MIIDNHKRKTNLNVEYKYFPFEDKFSSPEMTAHIEEISRQAISANDKKAGLDIILQDAAQIADWQKLAKDNAWLSLVPFYRPDADWRTQSADKVRPETTAWLTDQMLGRELRWRAAIEQKLLSDDFQTSRPKALILACGSGYQPVLAASINKDKNPKIVLLDFNANAIKHAKKLAKNHGVKVKTFVRDAVHLKDFKHDNFESIVARVIRHKRLTPASLRAIKNDFNSVTMIGLSMYLPDEDFPYQIEKQKKLRSGANLKIEIEVMKKGLKRMIQTMWDHTASGGWVTFDIIQRPDSVSLNGQRAELQHQVIQLMGWPSFQLRSIDQALTIISDLLIDPKEVHVYRSPEDFFAIFKLKKP